METHRNYLGHPMHLMKMNITNWDYQNSKGDIIWPDKPKYGIADNVAISGKKGSIEITLPIGKMLIRYGNKSGHFFADYGTEYEYLGLPYFKETCEYHVYRLNMPVTFENCGYVAEAFESKGGAMSYRSNCNVEALLDSGAIMEVDNIDDK